VTEGPAGRPQDDDSIPISIRLGSVVPPEDPEDWGRPLTWVAALGMLAAPIVAAAWFSIAPPRGSGELLPGTLAIAAAVVLGGVITGATQIGAMRAFAGTLGAALFGALGAVIVGAIMAQQRQVGSAAPTLAHAFVGALAGLFGALAASILAPPLAGMRSRARRALAPGGIGLALAIIAATRLV